MPTENETLFIQYCTANICINVHQRKNPSYRLKGYNHSSEIQHLYRVCASSPTDITQVFNIELNSIYEKENSRDTYILVPWAKTSDMNREHKVVGKENLVRFISILADNVDKSPEESWRLACKTLETN